MVEKPQDRPIEYWRARAEALEDELDVLKEFVWALAASLPADKAVAVLQGLSRGVQILPASEEATQPMASDVKTELKRIWESLAARRRDR